jgi:hypothetical protein
VLARRERPVRGSYGLRRVLAQILPGGAKGPGGFAFQIGSGYLNVTPQGDAPNVIPDPKRAAHVRMAFDLMAAGLHSKAEVLRTVTTRGLDTARGKSLSPQTLQKMLENPFCAEAIRRA